MTSKILVGVLVVLALICNPLTVDAGSPCPIPNICHDILINQDGRSALGVWEQSNTAFISSGDAIHANNTLWVHLNDASSDVLEIGLCRGESSSSCYVPFPGYELLYVAINYGQTPSDFHAIQWFPIDGRNHTFAIMSSGWDGLTAEWQFYLDGVAPAVYTQRFPAQTAAPNTAQVGGEVQVHGATGINSTQSINTFSDYVQLLYTDTSWHPWLNYTSHTDNGCSTGPPPGECFNAQIPSLSVWVWNKP
jgi:hypothetical protein